MQNYNKYFNVASDINIFLIIVHCFLKIITTCIKTDGYSLWIIVSNRAELFLLFAIDVTGIKENGFDLLRLGIKVIAQ